MILRDKRMWISGVALAMALAVPARADYGSADSADFSLDLTKINRGWADSADFSVTEPPPTAITWRSVRQHGSGAGELSIPLAPAATGNGVVSETRRYGIQKIEVDFDRSIIGLLVGTVVAENASYPGSTFPGTSQTLINDGTTLILGFGSGLPNGACYRIDLAGHITGLIGDTDCLVRGLAGDVNGDQNTNLIDMAWTKSRNMQPVTPDNVRFDVNLDGSVNLIDMAWVKSWNLGAATCPP